MKRRFVFLLGIVFMLIAGVLLGRWAGKDIASISIAQQPHKLAYMVGETLNTEGLLIEVQYADQTSAEISDQEVECTPKILAAGLQRITVTYQGQTATFNVSVAGAPSEDPPPAKAEESSAREQIPATGAEVTSRDIQVGKELILTARVSPENATVTAIDWQADNPGLVAIEIENRGVTAKITGKKAGEVTVTATIRSIVAKNQQKEVNIQQDHIALTVIEPFPASSSSAEKPPVSDPETDTIQTIPAGKGQPYGASRIAGNVIVALAVLLLSLDIMISIYAMKERRRRAEEERQYRAAERQREMNTKKAAPHTRQERYAYATKSEQTENSPIMEPRHTLTAASGKHQGTREYQEDALFVSETKSFSDKEAALMLGVVCDGMGGMADGALASNTAVNIVQREFQARETIEDIQQFIRATIVLANQQVHTQTKGSGGSTLVMVVIDHNKLYWGSVGDSRIYILRKGEIAQLTRDHNYSLTLMEQVGRQEISEQEARENPKKDALISFIGMDSLEIIDVSPSPFTLEAGDVVLLCSDGLYKTLTDGEIAAIIFQHYGQVAETARILPLMTFDRGISSQDNIAVILIQYDT